MCSRIRHATVNISVDLFLQLAEGNGSCLNLSSYPLKKYRITRKTNKTAQNHTLSITRQKKTQNFKLSVSEKEKGKGKSDQIPASSHSRSHSKPPREEGQSEKYCTGEKRGASGKPTIALKLPPGRKRLLTRVKILKKYSCRSKHDYKEGLEKHRRLKAVIFERYSF